MYKRSFIDLTALLDVMLILFFAAIINMAGSADVAIDTSNEMSELYENEKEKVENIENQIEESEASLTKALNQLELTEQELATLYGSKVEDLDDYREMLSKISKIEIMLVGNLNELWINGQETNIYIIRERLDTPSRLLILEKDIKNALNLAIEHRENSDILFLKIGVQDREVYKYAYDYLLDVLDEVVLEYGKDKVMLSKEFD
jgi:biopolymer transport protein ExbD